MSSPIRQEDASGRHDVPSGRQCIFRKLSAIASGRDRVVSRSSYVRLCVATGASIGRQYVVKQIIWRCTGDALTIFDELAVVKTAPVHRQTSPVGVKGALEWCSAHAQLMLAIRFLCNEINTRDLIGPCSHLFHMISARSVTPCMSPALHYRAYSNWSLAAYPFFSSSKVS